MADYYAAEYIDKLDELKININERQAVPKTPKPLWLIVFDKIC